MADRIPPPTPIRRYNVNVESIFEPRPAYITPLPPPLPPPLPTTGLYMEPLPKYIAPILLQQESLHDNRVRQEQIRRSRQRQRELAHQSGAVRKISAHADGSLADTDTPSAPISLRRKINFTALPEQHPGQKSTADLEELSDLSEMLEGVTLKK